MAVRRDTTSRSPPRQDGDELAPWQGSDTAAPSVGGACDEASAGGSDAQGREDVGGPSAKRSRRTWSAGEKVYYGVLKSFVEETEYGFIECPEAFNDYGADVVVQRSQAGNCDIGAPVLFRVHQGADGQPTAIVVDGGDQAAMGALCESSGSLSAPPERGSAEAIGKLGLLCPFFVRGLCRLGANCLFAHAEPGADSASGSCRAATGARLPTGPSSPPRSQASLTPFAGMASVAADRGRLEVPAQPQPEFQAHSLAAAADDDTGLLAAPAAALLVPRLSPSEYLTPDGPRDVSLLDYLQQPQTQSRSRLQQQSQLRPWPGAPPQAARPPWRMKSAEEGAKDCPAPSQHPAARAAGAAGGAEGGLLATAALAAAASRGDIGAWVRSIGLPQYEETLRAQYDDVSQICRLYGGSVGTFFDDCGIQDRVHRQVFASAISGANRFADTSGRGGTAASAG